MRGTSLRWISIFVFDPAVLNLAAVALESAVLNDWNYWNICREMTGERSPNGVNGMAR
jgi:hypothetical protein